MKRIYMIPLLLVSCFILVAGCGIEEDTPESLEISSDVPVGENDYEDIIFSNNKLGFNVFPDVEADEHNNIFISPTSLLMVLSMVYNGADGVTKGEIARTLHAEGMDVNELNEANASLMNALHGHSDDIDLVVANSIWLNGDFHFQDEFVKDTQDYFNAEIREIDVLDSQASKLINDWVKKSTNDKIEDIVDDPLDSDIVTILINAIYFQGDWTYEFDKSLTEKLPFYLGDETTKDVQLMTLNEELAYMENNNFQAVTLPYGANEGVSMKVFLPKKNSSLEDFQQLLTNENWISWNTEFIKTKGTIMLPKFQLEYETILNDVLTNLGMDTAFTENANFTKMIQDDEAIGISKLKQKTFIDVNEEGTEAAAATSGEIKLMSALEEAPFHMEVNRPFFLTLTDDNTGAILFMGSISNPQTAE